MRELLEAARRPGLALDPDSAIADETGLDFAVVHARDADGLAWVVRAPRRPEVRDAARVEARILALVRPRLPVAAPDWRIHTDELVAYPRLPGTPAVTLENGAPVWHLDPTAPPEAFLDSYAAAVSTLLGFPIDEIAATGARVRTVAEIRAGLARSFEVARPALEPPPHIWERWRRWVADDALWPSRVAFVHGDLHPGHLLIDDDDRLTGILDWTEAEVHDPVVDLALFVGCFGRPALEALVPRLEAAGVPTWPRMADHAAERWVAQPALGAEWALRTGNVDKLAFVRAQLAVIADAS